MARMNSGLGNLRDRHDDRRIFHRDRVLELRDIRKVVQERIAIGVGQLQRGAEQHGEEQEHGHIALLEQSETGQSQAIDQGAVLRAEFRRAFGQGERIQAQQQRRARGNVELTGRGFQVQQTGRPQRDDEANRAPHPDRRIVAHHILAVVFQRVVGNRNRQRDGRHVADHVQQHHPEHRRRVVDQRNRKQHDGAGNLQQAVQLLGVDPFVGNDAGDRGHEQRGDAHGRKDRAESGPGPMLVLEPVLADRDQPRAPDIELEEVHHDQSQFDAHAFSPNAQKAAECRKTRSASRAERRAGVHRGARRGPARLDNRWEWGWGRVARYQTAAFDQPLVRSGGTGRCVRRFRLLHGRAAGEGTSARAAFHQHQLARAILRSGRSGERRQ